MNTTLENSVYETTDWINSSKQKEWITNDRWKLGGISSIYTLSNFESAEKNSSFITSNHIGIMTVTDFGYGSSDNGCISDTNLNYRDNACMNSNWLKSTINLEWTIISRSESLVFSINALNNNLSLSNAFATNRGVRPVIILDSDVKIKSGNGTENDPYLLGK